MKPTENDKNDQSEFFHPIRVWLMNENLLLFEWFYPFPQVLSIFTRNLFSILQRLFTSRLQSVKSRDFPSVMNFRVKVA